MPPTALKPQQTPAAKSMTTLSNEQVSFLQAHPGIQAIDLLIVDMSGVIRGKRIEVDALDKVFSDGVFMPHLYSP